MNGYRWSDLHEGMTHEFSVQLERSMIDAFRALSGDTNPLHSDRSFATERGHSDVVAFGLLTSAFYSQLVGVHLPGRHCVLHGIDLDFVKPAYVGDALNVQGRVHHLNEAYRRVELRAQIRNQHGEVISRAKIRVGLDER